ncbi:MAG: glycosyltransferase family 9 protein [Ignavibacteriaceae bacterium]|jgi:heptosyltransferase-2
MAANNIFSNFIYSFVKKILEVPENKSLNIGNPGSILIVRQHNQLGDILAGVSILRAIKETYPGCHLTLLVSPENYLGLVKNKFIDRLFIFDKKKICNPFYFVELFKLLRESFDVVIVPVTVSISFTSNLIARFTNSKTRIGPSYLNGKKNESEFLFDRRVVLDWRAHPDSNVADRILDIVRPFGISTNNLLSEITFDKDDIETAEKFILGIKTNRDEILIGFHTGAGKIPNRWSLKKYIALMEKLKDSYGARFYLTGSSSDKEEIDFIKSRVIFNVGLFINKKITEVAALISLSDLFISNDTGIMHVAGITSTPQVSIFGPTNPFNWAPIGSNKLFIRKSEFIDDISVEDVYVLCESILKRKA